GAALPVIVGTAGAILCMLLAWQVSEQNRAILLHAAALACGVATVNAAASIAMAQGTRKPSCQPSQRLSFAYPWLMALCVLVILGIAWAVGN
ncbi:MAG: hypothetical protein FWD57_10045, partial [Polyangiaceae bacterium]|nr:hypothetical protein [Polyangiaceae bacterium]